MSELHIKELRESLGKTQTELAEMIGVSLRTIQNYESGGIIPKSKDAILRKLKNADENELELFIDKDQIKTYIEEISRLKKEIKILNDRLSDKELIIQMQTEKINNYEYPVIVEAKKGKAM